MTKVTPDASNDELPLDALVLQCKKDRYKIGYASLRWAKEIKQTENLPEPVPALIPRALREILTKKVSLKEIEKLPLSVKIAPPPPPPAAPPKPTITVKNTINEPDDEPTDKPVAEDKKES